MVGKLTPDNMLSASRIAQLLGMSPYATQNELLAEMIAKDEGTHTDNWEGNELTRWGDIHEPAIIKEVARRLHLRDVSDDFNEPFFHDTLPLACSLDGRGVGTQTVHEDPANGVFIKTGNAVLIADKQVLIECKTTQQAPEDTPPPHRGVLQLQAQMMCTGAEFGALAVLYRGSTLRIWIYQANTASQAGITKAVQEFEKRRASKEWYPVLTSDDGNVAFPRVDDKADPVEVRDNHDVQNAIEVLMEAKRLKKECDQTIDESQAIIKEFMGNHEEAHTVVDGQHVIVKWGMRNMKAQPEKKTPAKPAQVVRANTLTVKVLGDA